MAFLYCTNRCSPLPGTSRASARLASAALTAMLLASLAGTAAAQSAADKAAAEQLFKEARALMTNKNFEEACPKLEASLKLDAALGTRLNLASCYEEVGKLASAWGMYHEAADLAINENQPKRVKFAQDHAKALEPRLPKLVIAVAEDARVPGLRVTRDGTVVDSAVFGTAIYVDPGARTIVASAPGYKSFTQEVKALEGKQARLDVPALEEEPRALPAVDPAIGGVGEPPLPPLRDRGRSRRLLGLGVAGAGVASLAVGLGFGLSAKGKWDDAKADGKCNLDTNVCTPEGQALADSARTRATISTVTVSLGAVLAVTGGVLYFTAPRAERRTARLVPSAGRGSVGVALSGSF